jgi:glycosyltransferase involved in cell wall biosynthesis
MVLAARNQTPEKPWLSVIVLSHNRDRWLGTALQSLADQDDAGIEVIAVDSSVDDACWRIINAFTNKLDIRAERHVDLVSQGQKVNFGVTQARADYICVLHDDDLWAAGRCRELKRWVSIAGEAVMHLHPSYIIDESGRRLGVWRCPLASNQPLSSESLLRRLLVQNFIAAPAPTFRREAFLGAGGMDNRLWFTPDWDLWLKIAATGHTRYYPVPLTYYRIHNSSVTGAASKDIAVFREQYEIVLERHLPKLDETMRNRVLPLARTSISVNIALAAAAQGNYSYLANALSSLWALGPSGIRKYMTISRIVDRTFPRAWALVAARLRHRLPIRGRDAGRVARRSRAGQVEG